MIPSERAPDEFATRLCLADPVDWRAYCGISSVGHMFELRPRSPGTAEQDDILCHRSGGLVWIIGKIHPSLAGAVVYRGIVKDTFADGGNLILGKFGLRENFLKKTCGISPGHRPQR